MMVYTSAHIITWLMAVMAGHMVSSIRCVQCSASRGTCHSGALPSTPCPPQATHCFINRVWTPPREHWGRSFVWRGCSSRGPEVAGCQWVYPAGHERYMRCIDICSSNDCNSLYAPESWRSSEASVQRDTPHVQRRQRRHVQTSRRQASRNLRDVTSDMTLAAIVGRPYNV